MQVMASPGVCPCGESAILSGLCMNHAITAKALADFRFFFEKVYLPGTTLTEHQRRIAAYIQERIDTSHPVQLCILKGRRVGASEIICAFDLWYCLRNSERKIAAIYSYRAETSQYLYREKIRHAVSRNEWLRGHIMDAGLRQDKLQETRLRLKNDTLLFTDTSASSSGRGYDLDVAHFSEAAFIPEEFFSAASMSMMSGDNHIIMESTPRDSVGTFYEATRSPDYHVVVWPSIILSDRGRELLNEGRHAHWLPEHIIKINAINWNYDRIMRDVRKKTAVEVRREYLAEFVGGSELMYPPKLFDPLTVITPELLRSYGLYATDDEMEEDAERIAAEVSDIAPDGQETARQDKLAERLVDPMRWARMIDRDMRNFIAPWRFVMGIDWGQRDQTVVIVFAVRVADGHYQAVEVRSWNRIEYEDSYARVKNIFDRWAMAGHVEVRPDESAMQEQASSALLAMGVSPVVGFKMTATSKRTAARTLFAMMQEKRVRFIPDAPLRVGLLSVNYDVKSQVKGRKPHLDDYAAAVLCAIHAVDLRDVVTPAGPDSSLSDFMFEIG